MAEIREHEQLRSQEFLFEVEGFSLGVWGTSSHSKVYGWTPGGDLGMKQFAEIVYRVWLQKQQKFENFVQFTSWFLTSMSHCGVKRHFEGLAPKPIPGTEIDANIIIIDMWSVVNNWMLYSGLPSPGLFTCSLSKFLKNCTQSPSYWYCSKVGLPNQSISSVRPTNQIVFIQRTSVTSHTLT